MINAHGYHEGSWGSLAQWQTLHPNFPPKTTWTGKLYSGFDTLHWHPYEDLPRLPWEQRFKSFSDRLERAKARRAQS
ncbi:hypothetical protein [Rhizobium sp. BK251]|uniref:hypothetical protein n=1 Tax=Rhizobium sp. BK251 TaxID=2512125 RepID=UPI001049A9B5|nr:hypothetical protein [Rhizobium sp. BK251]TCL70546.1 hypothetical protein EV286_107421 [Rhizobium sp. BK251]